MVYIFLIFGSINDKKINQMNKTKSSLALLFLLCALQSMAQKSFSVSETTERIGDGSHPVFTVTVYEAPIEDVQKAWKSLMKDYKAKVDMNDVVFADNASISDVSANTVDVYAIIKSAKASEVEITAAFDLGGGYVSSSQYSSQAKAVKDIMRAFAVKTSKDAVADQLERANKELKKLNNEQEDLVKDNNNLHKKIEDWEQSIVKAKEDIKTNEKDQISKKEQIVNQGKVVETIKAKEADMR